MKRPSRAGFELDAKTKEAMKTLKKNHVNISSLFRDFIQSEARKYENEIK
jgi:hypothetical protein